MSLKRSYCFVPPLTGQSPPCVTPGSSYSNHRGRQIAGTDVTPEVMGSCCSQWHAGIAEEKQSCLCCCSVVLFFSGCFGSNNTKTRDGHTTTVLHSLWNQGCFSLFVVVLPLLLSTALLLELSPSQIHRVHRVFVCVEGSSGCVHVCICVLEFQCSVLRACLLKGETGKSQ